MDKEKQREKSLGIYSLGAIGIIISVITLPILVHMNRAYPEVFTLKRGVPIALYTLMLLISSCGLILYKEWARKLLIALFLTRIVGSMIKSINYVVNDLSQMKYIHLLEQSVNIIIFSLLIYFLCRKSISNKFRV